jgi:hypothetical protein
MVFHPPKGLVKTRLPVLAAVEMVKKIFFVQIRSVV